VASQRQHIGGLAGLIMEPTSDDLFGFDGPLTHFDLGRARVGTRQPASDLSNLLGRRQITLGQQQPIGHGDLPDGLAVASQLTIGVRDVDRRDHGVNAKAVGNEEILEQGIKDWRRIGETAGLDEHARKSGDFTPQATHEQIAQAARQFAADAAAQATRSENDDVLVNLVDQIVVDGDLAELVDQHCGVGQRRLPQEMIEQRRFSGTEKAGQDGYRNRPFPL
jgi:hypothetical protein